MGKASRRKKVVNPAALAQYRAPIPFVARPFEGLPREVELVAMREIIPCATLTARTNADHGFVDFDFVTALPDGRGAMVRGDGRILVALQTRSNSGDLSHDAGAALLNAISAKQNGDEGLVDFDVRDPSERLQDILDPDSFGEMVLEENFAFWLNPDEDWDEATRRALEENHNEIIPTVKVEGVEGMYWCEMNRNFVRYLSDVEESPLFDALARVQAAGKANLGEGSRFIGAFRACGIAIPVFELAEGVRAEDIVKEAGVLEEAIAAALKVKEPLTPEERRARQGMVSRQVTIR
ncbi:DUF5926 family protein [Schaalia cardiffensis]|uniref:DUF5926 domain-containing protein n=1 Tax=Schaalia cardiffensis F0333 TaxID=888050 RepID=N6W6Y8_9ACTO|nr:DUF5926 family protein [Schaalia cardiffensis]ENO18275.1 hypothetical protein HMPREF9004_0844 [Schaalia cardiffensis F0333]